MRNLICTLLGLTATALAELVRHDASFVPDLVLQATEGEIDLDCQKRCSVLFNGTFPGSTIRLAEGKTTWIRVYNNMADQNLTVHWHSLTQRTAPFSGGTPLVAQWPIPPSVFFDYEVRPQKEDRGTYFYHSHVGMAQTTAHGALIVKTAGGKKEPYPCDDDRLLTVSTYYPATDEIMVQNLTANPMTWPGDVSAITINGKSGTSGFNNDTCSPAIINVEPGKRYLLRVIGASSLPIVKLGIPGHKNLTVIEADGEFTMPQPIDHMQVAPGQRYSYILRTKTLKQLDKSDGNFWVYFTTRDRQPSVVSGYALLRYKLPKDPKKRYPTIPIPSTSPVTLPNTMHDYLEGPAALQPLSQAARDNFPRLSAVTRAVTLNMHMMLSNGNWFTASSGAIEPNGTLDWAANELCLEGGPAGRDVAGALPGRPPGQQEGARLHGRRPERQVSTPWPTPSPPRSASCSTSSGRATAV